VLLDGGAAGPHHVVEGDRPLPAPHRGAAAEDGERGGEPAGHVDAVLQMHQVAQDLRAAVPVLHLVDVVLEAVDLGLDAAGDVDDGAVRGVLGVLAFLDGDAGLEQRGVVGGADLRVAGELAVVAGCHLGGRGAVLHLVEDHREDLPGEVVGLLAPG
ncbi:hypothetical protein CW663_11565, partial [Macrococcoides caseolyticum]